MTPADFSERALLAALVRLSPEDLESLLQRMMSATLNAIAPSASTNRDEWSFVGADSIQDALSASQASVRLYKNALKSLGHALAAFESLVRAIVDHHEHREHFVIWRQRQEALEDGDLARLANATPQSHQQWLAETRRDAWRLLLRDVA